MGGDFGYIILSFVCSAFSFNAVCCRYFVDVSFRSGGGKTAEMENIPFMGNNFSMFASCFGCGAGVVLFGKYDRKPGEFVD